MAKCRQCGNWLPDNALLCNVCGTRQDQYQQPQYQPPQFQPIEPVQQVQNTWTLPKDEPAETPPAGEQTPPEQPQKPEKKKLTKGKKILLFSIIGVLAAAIIGVAAFLLLGDSGSGGGKGGKDDEDDPILGRYYAVSCTVDDEEMDVEDLWVDLKDGGRIVLRLSDGTFSGKWELDDEDITVTQDGDKYYGTLEDGVLTLEMEDMLWVFSKNEPADPEAGGDTPTTPQPVTPDDDSGKEPAPDPENPTVKPAGTPVSPNAGVGSGIQWWTGDWYGWWIIEDGTGNCANLVGNFWDVCGRFYINPDGSGSVSMWDQDEGPSQSRWEVNVIIEEGSDDRGILVSRGGSFWNSNLLWDDWKVDPYTMPYDEFTMIHITGHWEDRYNPANTCEYSVFLRPWGTSWEDLRGRDVRGMPYDDMMPALYDDWYLPLIQSGSSMPDRFPID